VTASSSQIVERLRRFLYDECGIDGANIEAGSPLFTTNRLSSLDLLDLVAMIEREYGLAIAPHEVSFDSFDTLDQIAAFIVSRKAAH
jgi:acyl carrier protein